MPGGFRLPNLDDPFEALLAEHSHDDERIVASSSIPYGDFEERVYVCVNLEADDPEIVSYRISNPHGEFRTVRGIVTSVGRLCADVVPTDERMMFQSPVLHLPLDAALQRALEGHVGVVFQTGVAKEAFYFARTSGIGRVDEIVVAHARWTGSDKVFRKQAVEGMKAFEAGDNVQIRFLTRMSIPDFTDEIASLAREPSPAP